VALTVTLTVTLAPRSPIGLGHHRDVGRRRRRRAAVATAAAEAATIATAEAAAIATTTIAAAALARRTTGATIEPRTAATRTLTRRTTGTTIEPGAAARAVARRTAVATWTTGAPTGTPIITLDARRAAVAAGGAVEATRSRATTTAGALLCLVHAQRASVEVGAVHRGGSRLRLGLGGQFDEGEATRSARLTVHHQEDIRHRTPIGAERISEGLFSRAVCQVAYVESRSHCEAQGPSAAHRSIVSSFTRTKVSS
jgi:hypothetical protein